MQKFFVLFTIGAAFFALSAVACGDSKPPLTPDSEHSELTEAGAPSAPSSAAPATSAPAPAK